MMFPRLWRTTRGTAAAEMALVMPLLLILMMGSVEIGNYFYNEHILVKAVRDGARYAARQNFSYYQDSGGACSSPTDTTMIGNVKTLVRSGLLSGGTDRLARWNSATFTMSALCYPTSNSQNMLGIYRGAANGAPVVTVSVIIPYQPVLSSFGFSGIGLNLNATQQAAVMGI